MNKRQRKKFITKHGYKKYYDEKFISLMSRMNDLRYRLNDLGDRMEKKISDYELYGIIDPDWIKNSIDQFTPIMEMEES